LNERKDDNYDAGVERNEIKNFDKNDSGIIDEGDQSEEKEDAEKKDVTKKIEPVTTSNKKTSSNTESKIIEKLKELFDIEEYKIN
jgi:hypothetical protein